MNIETIIERVTETVTEFIKSTREEKGQSDVFVLVTSNRDTPPDVLRKLLRANSVFTRAVEKLQVRDTPIMETCAMEIDMAWSNETRRMRILFIRHESIIDRVLNSKTISFNQDGVL